MTVRSLLSTLIIVVIVDLLATAGDITSTWTSPIYPKLQSNDSSVNPFGYPITTDEESWIASVVYIGGILGPIPYGLLSAKFGRKIALLCIAIPHIVSYITLAFARKVYLYYMARAIGGLAYGGGYALLPLYVAEITQDSTRGAFSVTLNIFWCLGNLMPYTIGPYVSIMCFNLILACVPVSFFLLFLAFGPETPYYLMRKGEREKAKKALRTLRHCEEKEIDEELSHIEEVLEHDEHGKLMDLFRSKSNLKALTISIFLAIAQQMSGVAAVLLYTQEIFEAAGAKGISPELSSIIVGLVLLGSSFIVPFFTDRLGRRPLLNVSWLGMTVSLTAFGVYYNLQSYQSSLAWLPVTSLVFYIIMLNIGAGSVFWTLTAELFPSSVKSMASALISSVCWATAVLVSKFFDDWNDSLGKGGTFFMFGGWCLAAFLFTFFLVPETKNRSFKDIQLILERDQIIILEY